MRIETDHGSKVAEKQPVTASMEHFVTYKASLQVLYILKKITAATYASRHADAGCDGGGVRTEPPPSRSDPVPAITEPRAGGCPRPVGVGSEPLPARY